MRHRYLLAAVIAVVMFGAPIGSYVLDVFRDKPSDFSSIADTPRGNALGTRYLQHCESHITNTSVFRTQQLTFLGGRAVTVREDAARQSVELDYWVSGRALTNGGATVRFYAGAGDTYACNFEVLEPHGGRESGISLRFMREGEAFIPTPRQRCLSQVPPFIAQGRGDTQVITMRCDTLAAGL